MGLLVWEFMTLTTRSMFHEDYYDFWYMYRPSYGENFLRMSSKDYCKWYFYLKSEGRNGSSNKVLILWYSILNMLHILFHVGDLLFIQAITHSVKETIEFQFTISCWHFLCSVFTRQWPSKYQLVSAPWKIRWTLQCCYRHECTLPVNLFYFYSSLLKWIM